MDAEQDPSWDRWERWSWLRAAAAVAVLMTTTLAAVTYYSFAFQFGEFGRQRPLPRSRIQYAGWYVLAAGVLLGAGPLWVWRRRRSWPWLVAGLGVIGLAVIPAVACFQGRVPDLPLVPQPSP